MGVHGDWEDPFLWQDVRGAWHILSHTYTHQPGGPGVQNSISGHLFATDVTGPWHVSPVEPYACNPCLATPSSRNGGKYRRCVLVRRCTLLC